MEFTIYSIGDSEFLEQVLISLAMITDTDDFGAMIQVGLLVGVFSTILSAIAKGGREIEFQHVLLGYIIWSTMFIPTSRVLIEDTYTGNVAVVDNVPMGAAAAGGIISLIGFKITELFEVSYGPIIPRVTQTEFGESLRILNDIRSEATNGGIWRGLNKDAGGGVDLRKSWVNYIRDCTLRKIDLGIMTADEFATDQYQVALRFDAILFGTRIYTDPAFPDGENVDCAEGWNQLDNKTNVGDQTKKAFDAILGFDSNNLPTGEDSSTKTQTALASLLSAGITAQDYMKIAILDPIVKQATSGKYDLNQDMSGALMINQAIQQRNTQWAAEQSLFMTIVRPMLAFFEAFIYAVTPIMAFVIVLGSRGVQLAGKYFALLIWIQLWMPILSVVNLYIYISASRKMETYALMEGHNWNSFYALNSAADVMQNWIATGGLLASSTPAIALMLIYGSSVTATHLAGRLKSTDSIDQNYQTPDIKNNKPLADVDSKYSGDSVNGLMLNGTQGTLGTATVSSVFTSMAQSGKSVQNTESEQFSDSLAHSVNSSQNANEFFSKAQVAGVAASSGDSTISRNAMSQAHAFVESHGLDQGHTESVAGVAALSASLGANLDVDKAAG
ncbi:MAG: conjugal transfer protein TraG N-terminal domain-containing protein, partial [Pseudomonadales bacterium]|nr:conjugal transfer protein TraG N-terminal domain-containing protein [Pseudomonadales bacterium]